MMITFTVRCQQKRHTETVQKIKCSSRQVIEPYQKKKRKVIEILKDPKSPRVLGTKGLRGLKAAPQNTHKMSFITCLPCSSYDILTVVRFFFSLTQTELKN